MLLPTSFLISEQNSFNLDLSPINSSSTPMSLPVFVILLDDLVLAASISEVRSLLLILYELPDCLNVILA